MYRKNSILLLEDNEIEGKKIQRIFEGLEKKYTLQVCKNGVEGLVWLEQHPKSLPLMIILDLYMPEMDGVAFLAEVKKHEKYRYIPVIVFTNSDDPRDIEKCYQLSVAGYMVKPTQNKEFISTILRIKDYWEKCEFPY